MTEREREASLNWKLEVCRDPCVMCREFPVRDERIRRDYAPDLAEIEGHHIVAQQTLRNNGHRARLWDVRNGLALCRYHHRRHENWVQRVPMDLLPAAVYDFAREVGLEWVLQAYRRR